MADAPASGAGGRKVVKVQVLSFAQAVKHESLQVVTASGGFVFCRSKE